MLKYKVGDLIQAAKSGEVHIIAHCANCFCTMGSGIAPLIAHEFPNAHRADQRTISGDKDKLGTLSWGLSSDGPLVQVFNLYGQYGYWGRKQGKMDLDYAALRRSFKAMSKEISWSCTNQGVYDSLSIGLPKLGAGLAGGDWEIISTIIEEELCSRGLDVTVYVLSMEELPYYD